jgi:iron complex outermembrane receptor protein
MSPLFMKFPTVRVRRCGLFLAACCSLHAQQASPAPASDPKKPAEETIVLSPFVVESSEDQGWRATNTLAGTRLRTSLNDLAQPISVMTSEFLQNIGATDMQQALLYSTNVENENQYTPVDVNGNAQADTNVNRVRGIAAGTTTRGFFQTRFRIDTYNTDGITIASGPNSILFGIGSPAGIIDASPAQANARKFSGSFANVVDNNSSWRFSLDFNAPLIKDKLAIRAAFLKQDQETWIKPAYDKESRQYVTMKADPFPGTTIRASYEHMKDDRVRAQQGLIIDQITQWIALGKPLYDPNTDRWTWDHGSTWQSRPDLRNWRYDQVGEWPYNDRVFIQAGGLGSAQGIIWKNVGGTSWDARNSFLSHNSFRDASIIDPTVNYFGDGNVTRLKGEVKNLVIDQKITDEIFAQVAYNKETHDRWQQNSYRYGISSIKGDVNYYLPYNSSNPGVPNATTLNPNRGRVYIEGSSLVMIVPSSLETKRAMLTYSPDFRKGGLKWLGHYNFGAMYERTSNQTIQVQNWLVNTGSMQVGTNMLDVGSNGIVTRSYLNVPGLGGDTSGVDYPRGSLLPPWPSLMTPNNGSSTPLAKITGDALMAVGQAYLLDDNLVLTFGIRKDKQDVHNFVYTNPDRLSGTLTDDNKSTAAADAGLSGGLGLTSDSGTTKTYGAVWHTPLKWLSLLYNHSNTFNPQNHLIDIFHNPLSASTGVGQDYGVMVNLLDDKLSLKLTAYKNTSEHASCGQNYLPGPGYGGFGDYWNLAGLFHWGSTWNELTSTSYTDAMAASLGLPTRTETLKYKTYINDITNYSYNLVFTRSEISKGYEMELLYRPSSNWDLRLTAAKADAKNNVYYPEMLNFIDTALPIWKKYFPLIQDWNGWNANPVPAGVDANWQNNPDTVGYQFNHNLMPMYAFIKQLQGRADDRARQWRASLLTDYRFTKGALKGVAVGGAWRWRSAAAIGYYGMQNPYQPNDPTALMPDLSRPIKGSSESFVDAWVRYGRNLTVAGKRLGYTVQLNVQNLVNHSPIVVTARNYDRVGTPSNYQKLDPIKITLSNTLKF